MSALKQFVYHRSVYSDPEMSPLFCAACRTVEEVLVLFISRATIQAHIDYFLFEAFRIIAETFGRSFEKFVTKLEDCGCDVKGGTGSIADHVSLLLSMPSFDLVSKFGGDLFSDERIAKIVRERVIAAFHPVAVEYVTSQLETYQHSIKQRESAEEYTRRDREAGL